MEDVVEYNIGVTAQNGRLLCWVEFTAAGENWSFNKNRDDFASEVSDGTIRPEIWTDHMIIIMMERASQKRTSSLISIHTDNILVVGWQSEKNG